MDDPEINDTIDELLARAGPRARSSSDWADLNRYLVGVRGDRAVRTPQAGDVRLGSNRFRGDPVPPGVQQRLHELRTQGGRVVRRPERRGRREAPPLVSGIPVLIRNSVERDNRDWVAARDTAAAEPGTDLSIGVPDELTAGEKDRHGASPWQLAGRRLRRNKTALAFGALFLVLVGRLPGGAALRGPRREPNPVRPARLRRDRRQGRRGGPGRRPRRRPDRPDLQERVLPGRGLERPRRGGPAALRRAQLAPDRRRRGARHDLHRRARSASSPATSAAGPTA